jgi:formylglycine-generating enzyme required for sulfatase activity
MFSHIKQGNRCVPLTMVPLWTALCSVSVSAAALGAALCLPSLAGERASNAIIRESFANRAKELTIAVGGRAIAFCYVPPGKFIIGSPPKEEGHEDSEGPARTVKISRGFYVSKYELTQAQYEAVTGKNHSDVKGEGLPCNGLLFRQARQFCKKASDISGAVISLPTEAQWEYACRAGTATRYHSGDTEDDLGRVAWYKGNSGDRPHPVGEKQPNAYGLYDMHGNVSEFCIDFPLAAGYDEYAESDPIGILGDGACAVRGGDWLKSADNCRSACRGIADDSGLRFHMSGIRLVINEPGE